MADTELEAVNMCLAGIGIARITIDEITTDADAVEALAMVTQITNNVQLKGMWFNKEPDWNLTPDETTGEIEIPEGANKIVTSGCSRNLNLSKRGDRLYDMDNHTYDLRDVANQDGDITFVITMRLDFEDMPESARTAVAYIARRMFAQDSEVDATRWNFQSRDEKNAMIAMEREDAQSKKRNSITDNSTIQSFLLQVGGVNSRF